MNVVEASGLGKRYGSTWALHECTLAIPAGHVAALVGPNSAGVPRQLQVSYSSGRRMLGPPTCRPRGVARPPGSSHASCRPSAVRSR